MPVSVRSCLTAGVAVVGAGAIALSPVSPIDPSATAPPTVIVPAASSTSVELTALTNPLEAWAQVIVATGGNLSSLADTVLADPTPILDNVVDNQLISARVLARFVSTAMVGDGVFSNGLIGALAGMGPGVQAAIEQITSGDIEAGTQALLLAVITPVVAGVLPALLQLEDVVAVLQNPFDNISNVIDVAVPGLLVGVGLPLLTQVMAPVMQIGSTGQKIFDGIQDSDFEAVATALINFPAEMTNTILNGDSVLGTGGLLGLPGGMIAGLLDLRKEIADAITAPTVSIATQSRVAMVDAAAEDTNQGALEGKVDSAGAESPSVEGSDGDTNGDTDGAATLGSTPVSQKVIKKAPLAQLRAQLTAESKSEAGSDSEAKSERANAGARAADAVRSAAERITKGIDKIGSQVKAALSGKKTKSTDAGSDAKSSGNSSSGSDD